VQDEALDPVAYDAVVRRRDAHMAGRLRDLASMAGLARMLRLGLDPRRAPPRVVLAVVGRSHVAGLRRLLEREGR
jgi:pheromone shutdown protein TraB